MCNGQWADRRKEASEQLNEVVRLVGASSEKIGGMGGSIWRVGVGWNGRGAFEWREDFAH